MENLLGLSNDIDCILNSSMEISSIYSTLSNHLLLNKLNLLETEKAIFRLNQDNLKSIRLINGSNLDPEDKCYHEFVVSTYALELSLLEQKQNGFLAAIDILNPLVKRLEDGGYNAEKIINDVTQKTKNLISRIGKNICLG
jgi:hypothetical protein